MNSRSPTGSFWTRILHRKITFLPILSLVIFTPAIFADDRCPAIHCDCESIGLPTWKQICIDHEVHIKTACVANQNKPRDYCSIHGPAATPVPMILEMRDIVILPADNIAQSHKQIATLYWSAHTDLDLAKSLVKKSRYGEAQEVLRLAERNMDTLFDQQRQITLSHIANEKAGRAKGAWKDYSGDSLKMAERLFQYGEELREMEKSATEPHAIKAYGVLLTRVMRMASKGFEMAGHAYVGSENNTAAARAWKRAADVSAMLLDQKVQENAAATHVNYYRMQVAARLHRASYYWTLDKRQDDARRALEESMEFAEEKELLARILAGEFSSGKSAAAEEAGEEILEEGANEPKATLAQ